MRPPLPFIVAAVILVLLLFSSVYTVSETEQAILVQFGMPVGGLVKDPGLHLKVPFIQDVHRFDKRWLEFDADPREVPTKDKKYIWVDAYARWRIVDPLRFYQAVGDERGAQSRSSSGAQSRSSSGAQSRSSSKGGSSGGGGRGGRR